jgi:hypothetical protein
MLCNRMASTFSGAAVVFAAPRSAAAWPRATAVDTLETPSITIGVLPEIQRNLQLDSRRGLLDEHQAQRRLDWSFLPSLRAARWQ